MNQLTVALAKGRLGEKGAELLEMGGLNCGQVGEPGRKLVITSDDGLARFILVKPSDVPTYVERGVADIGIVGKDTLMESGCSVYEMLDLGFGKCRLCIAGPAGALQNGTSLGNLRVATKYPAIAHAYFGAQGIPIDVIKLNGSVELGPLVGLSDVILDIVESGRTLQENGLEVLQEICAISARLIVNKVSLKTKGDIIKPVIDNIRLLLEGRT